MIHGFMTVIAGVMVHMLVGFSIRFTVAMGVIMMRVGYLASQFGETMGRGFTDRRQRHASHCQQHDENRKQH